MFHWLHHLFNPHCPDCKQLDDELYERDKEVEEFLKNEVARLQIENKLLLDRILAMANPVVESPKETPQELHVVNKNQPWRTLRQKLESESRDRAKQIVSERAQILNAAPKLENIKLDTDAINDKVEQMEQEIINAGQNS